MSLSEKELEKLNKANQIFNTYGQVFIGVDFGKPDDINFVYYIKTDRGLEIVDEETL